MRRALDTGQGAPGSLFVLPKQGQFLFNFLSLSLFQLGVFCSESQHTPLPLAC